MGIVHFREIKFVVKVLAKLTDIGNRKDYPRVVIGRKADKMVEVVRPQKVSGAQGPLGEWAY